MSADNRTKEILRDMAIAVTKLRERVAKLEERLKDPVQISVSENRGATGILGSWPWPDDKDESQ